MIPMSGPRRMEPAVFLAAIQGRRVCVRLRRVARPIEIPIESALLVWEMCAGRVQVLQRDAVSVVEPEPSDRRYRVGDYRGESPLDPPIATGCRGHGAETRS